MPVKLAFPFRTQKAGNDLASSMPRRTCGELIALQHDDIGYPKMGQLVGDVSADGTATDDDDLRLLRKGRVRHVGSFSGSGFDQILGLTGSRNQ